MRAGMRRIARPLKYLALTLLPICVLLILGYSALVLRAGFYLDRFTEFSTSGGAVDGVPAAARQIANVYLVPTLARARLEEDTQPRARASLWVLQQTSNAFSVMALSEALPRRADAVRYDIAQALVLKGFEEYEAVLFDGLRDPITRLDVAQLIWGTCEHMQRTNLALELAKYADDEDAEVRRYVRWCLQALELGHRPSRPIEPGGCTDAVDSPR